WIEEDLGAHEHHGAGRFRIPLIPADADAERRHVRAVPDLETSVAGAEVELLFITRAVGDVALTVDSGDSSVWPYHRERIVVVWTVEFEEAGRDPDLQLLRQLLHRDD